MAERTKFPPEELTDDEVHAIKGRFVMDPTPLPAPHGDWEDDIRVNSGRTPPPPHGVVWINPDGPSYAK